MPEQDQERRARSCRCGLIGVASAVSARMPPSPWLSARSTNGQVLDEMTSISDQKISESTPRTLSCVGGDRSAGREALADRVERTGADVAVDDAQRGKRDGEEIPATLWVTVTVPVTLTLLVSVLQRILLSLLYLRYRSGV